MNLSTRLTCRMNELKGPLVNRRDRLRFADRDGWPIRSGDTEHSAFFIVGFPRSGSTLLRAIISEHPDIFIPPENGGLGPMIAAFMRLRGETWAKVVDSVIAAFESGYESSYWNLDTVQVREAAMALDEKHRSLTRLVALFYETYGAAHCAEASRWGDKTMPSDCTYLYKLGLAFNRSRFIHIVRDGRDAVASALKHNMFRGDITEAGWNWKNCSVQWRRFVSDLGSPERTLVIHYEKLVSDAEKQVQILCDFLDLEPTPEMLTFKGAKSMGDVNKIDHHANVRKPISAASVGRGRSQLTAAQLKHLDGIFGRQMRSLAYR